MSLFSFKLILRLQLQNMSEEIQALTCVYVGRTCQSFVPTGVLGRGHCFPLIRIFFSFHFFFSFWCQENGTNSLLAYKASVPTSVIRSPWRILCDIWCLSQSLASSHLSHQRSCWKMPWGTTLSPDLCFPLHLDICIPLKD